MAALQPTRWLAAGVDDGRVSSNGSWAEAALQQLGSGSGLSSNNSGPFGEGVCCGFFHIHVAGIGSLAGVISSAVLAASLAGFVWFLHRAYVRMHTRDRLPLDALLLRRPKQAPGKENVVVLPAYHAFALGVCLLFFLQAVAWLMPAEAPYDKLSSALYSLCTFADLTLVIHMIRSPTAGFTASMAVAGALSIGVFIFVIMLHTPIDCEWCSIHTPRPGVEIPYTIFGSFFIVVGLMSKFQVRVWPFTTAPRPALANWAFTLSFAYILSAIGLWLLHSRVSSGAQEGAFCLLDIALVQYALLYAPMFYNAMVRDSEYLRRLDLKAALQNSAFAPLLTSTGEPNKLHYGTATAEPGRAAVGEGKMGQKSKGPASLASSLRRSTAGAIGGTGAGPAPAAANGAGGAAAVGGAAHAGLPLFSVNADGVVGANGSDPEGDALDDELESLVNDPRLQIIDVNDIALHRRIGAGGYGSVWYAEWRGCACAVKELFALGPAMNESSAARAAAKALLHEVTVLASLRYPHCVTFYGLVLSQRLQGIVMEYLDGGSIHDILHVKQAPLSLVQKSRILHQCVSGMNYLHKQTPALLHRDLKTRNLLADDCVTVVKVTDFGLATRAGSGTLTAVGTPAWAAPEVLRHERYSTAADVFSFGCVLWEVWRCVQPWHNVPAVRVAHAVAYENLRLPLPDWTPDSLRAVLQACWAADPQLRPTFEDLQHWTKTLHSSDILAIPEGVDPTANPLPRELLSMR